MAGVYFHFPFCRQACHYCNFHFSTSFKYLEQMLEAFEKEILLRKDELCIALESIYFGGGSPSLMPPKSLERLIGLVGRYAHFNDNIEITLEANPDDVSPQYLHECKSIGVNRLSLGIQSFHDTELKLINRIHDGSQALEAIENTAVYFDNFSVDLIYGVPGSNLSSWESNLQQALTFAPCHLSCYALTVEPKTVLDQWVQEEKVMLLDEKLVKSQYDLLIDRLEGHYENYEFSNFCKNGFQSVNNSNYWKGKAYVGIGPGAHSYDGKRYRSWNPSNNLKYLKSIREGHLPSTGEHLKTHEAFNEFVMTGLRTIWGTSLHEIHRSFGQHYADYLEKQATQHLIEQRLYWDGDALKVAKKAKFLTDGIAADLFMLKG